MRQRTLFRRRIRTWAACIDDARHPGHNLKATPSRIKEWWHDWRWHR